MIRRLFVCCTMLGCGLLLWTQAVRAQGCRVIHSENLGVPSTDTLLPNEAGTQGATTVTLTIQPSVSGGTPSHNVMGMTVGTHGTVNWQTNNASLPLSLYFSLDNGPKSLWSSPVTASGSFDWTAYVGWAGHTVTYTVMDNGQTTQDRINIGVVSGMTGQISFEDDFPTNYYEELKNNFNGTTSMNFEYCPGAATATHTAPFFGTLTNPTTGETASFNTSIAFRPNGGYNEEIPPIYVSFLPGDKPPQTSTTGRVMCTIAGDFVGLIAATGDSTKNQRVDKKMWTKVKIATTVQASDGGWYTENWCSEKEPPIWNPNELYTSLAPLNQYYWTAQTCSSSPPGTDPGPGWHCPAISGGPGPGNPQQFFPSLTSSKGGCNTEVNTPAPY